MKRLLCVLTLGAFVLVPDWASACWIERGRPVYVRPYAPIRYRVPAYYAPVYYVTEPVYCQPIYLPPCTPTSPPMMHPPRVEQPTAKEQSKVADPLFRQIPRADTEPYPKTAPLHPASGVKTPPKVEAKPEPIPPTKLPESEPKEPKRGGLFSIPKDTPTAPNPKSNEPVLPIKMPDDITPKLPPLTLPSDVAPKLPPIDLPLPREKEKTPELPDTPAIPLPAPPPDVTLPPLPIPGVKNPDTLPPLTLPPDSPVAPPPPPSVIEAKSSPIAGAARELKVSVLTATGGSAAPGLCKIGFYNHTKRDLKLVIEGQEITLPAMTYLHAQMPPSFTWKCPDRGAKRERVPVDASGLDVLIRE